MQQILLGPLLGIESDTRYSVCILVDKSIANCRLTVSTLENYILPEYSEDVLDRYVFHRFSFQLANDLSGILTYSVLYGDTFLKASNGFYFWKVFIREQKEEPALCFVSCNGSDKKYPTDIPDKIYGGWQDIVDRRPDYLFLTGDQIYSDTIIDKIPFLQGSTDKLADCPATEIERCFVQLYIDSWSNKHLNLALATIPNCMTWDDHDIIDGYGSYRSDIQELLKPIFKVAQKFYHLFQLRVAKCNTSLFESSSGVYNQYIRLQNFHILAPDTRSNRSFNMVLSEEQYAWLSAVRLKNTLSETDQINNQTIIAIIPIPLAHMDFYNFIEVAIGWLDKLFTRSFLKMNSDDAIDHWDHKYHRREQLKLLKLLFGFGDCWNIRHLIFVSGDVHCAGASTVIKLGENKSDERFATQLITSPIVNQPSFRLLKYFASRYRYLGEDIGYLLKDFGSLKSWLVNQRNYLIVGRGSSGSMLASLYIEDKNSNWEDEQNNYRSINLFKGSGIENADRERLTKLRKKVNHFNYRDNERPDGKSTQFSHWVLLSGLIILAGFLIFVKKKNA